MQLAYRPLTVQEMTENGLVYYATINNLTQNGALEGLVEMDESQLGQDPEDKIENGTPAPQEPPGPDREQAEGEQEQPRPPRKVLVVEDSENWPDTLSRFFTSEEIEFVIVDSVEAAEVALAEGGFTEILTDGLEGDWVGVVDISGDMPVRLLTAQYKDYKPLADEMGISILDKFTLDWMDAVLEEPLAQTP
ncbi:hypothetical protein KJ965_03295 [Patescibacteria group bacterium]|nr:hypothetical protein [Patescibacteria group bacterium]